ncbi:translesion DNA synthesis-associated protein ImuA [Vibrio sp. ZSDZ65]|uniref:Translesion DNA synthesis-associated protein ImuA n=1 Tax=Vibrio qingdaonensis TaxID=2829491 RepID=A0A9X3CM58_9VIBR|nr:translesion DNA synthesis-associated protein ImuA [Vibrio qingdaonensis]MCW8344925.1 translesion DNA synthesis-associated protein ImuA [Vibrio qingdaonensis]
MHTLIKELQDKQLIWKGSHAFLSSADHRTTGFDELDQRLNGGFPSHGVVDIQSIGGIGELRLLLPHITTCAQKRLLILINPPGYLCADYLLAQGIQPSQVLILYPTSAKHALWAAEQSLKSGASGCVCLWQNDIEIHQAKRLQVASETGQCLQFLFRQVQPHIFSLPVSLGLTLVPHDSGLEVSITKQKGGFSRHPFIVNMTMHWPELTVAVEPNASTVISFPMQQQG